MAKTRTQKAALNTSTAALSEVVALVCGLILPRLILAHFGSTYNGITSSAKQFLSAISILNVGVAGTTRFALYRALADNDIQKTSRIVKATELHLRKIGTILILYTSILIVFYPMFVNTGYSWIEVAPLIFAASLSSLGRYFFGMTYRALLMADQCVYVSNVFAIIFNILNTTVNIILINAGCNIQTVRVVAALVLLMNPIMLRLYVKRKYTLDGHCEPDYSALSMRRDVMAHSIANIVHDNTDIIVLTVFTNVRLVSVYTVYNLVMAALKKTQTVFTSGTEAIFGNMWAKSEFAKIRYALETYEYIVTFVISTIYSTSLIMILPFISLYTKGVHDVEYIIPSYALVITTAQAWFCMRAPYLTLVQGVGHYKQTKKGAYFEAAINLIVSVILVQFIGIAGVAVGTLIANMFRTLQYAVYIDNNLVKRGKSAVIKRIIWTVANVFIVYELSTHFVRLDAYSGWMMWVICSCIVVAISFAVTIVSSLIFYKKDMKSVIKILENVVKRRKRKK